MANVLFKRGLESALPANGSAVDGALYFTTDTKRLFLGLSDHTRIPIAEGITTVESVTDLPAAGASNAGQFYYASNGNILAYSDGSSWLQVNNSSYVSSGAIATASDGQVTLTLSQTGGPNAGQTVTASFVLTASDNVTIAKGGANELIISSKDDNTTYALTTSALAADAGASVILTSNEATNNVQSFDIKKGTGINVVRGNDGSITISTNASEIGGIADVTLAPGNGESGAEASNNGFYIDITGTDNSHKTDTLDPTIVYGGSANQTAHFVSGAASLAVYTASEVDDLIEGLEKTLDAVTYRGTVASESDLNVKGAVHNGDAWKASSDFVIGSGNGAVNVPAGALIIARGTETDGAIPAGGVTYDVITGDTTDTTYSFVGITNGVKLHNSQNADVGSFALATNSAELTLTDSGTTDAKTVTINLADVTVGTTTGTAVVQNATETKTFAVISAVSTDSKGRVTGVETTSVTVVDTVLNSARTLSVAAANNVATITDTVADTAGTSATASYSIGTSSGSALEITASGSAINVDLVWGDFS